MIRFVNHTALHTVFSCILFVLSLAVARSPQNPPNKAIDILIFCGRRTISIRSVSLLRELHSALLSHPAQLLQPLLLLLDGIINHTAFGFHMHGARVALIREKHCKGRNTPRF